MEENRSERTTLGTILTWTIVILAAIVAIKLLFWLVRVTMVLLGTAFGIVAFVLFTVGPILLVGWLLVKVFGYLRRRPTV